MSTKTNTTQDELAAKYSLTEREEVTLARIRLLTGNPDLWLQEYARIAGKNTCSDKPTFFAFVRLVASASYEHQEAEDICRSEGFGVVRKWVRHGRDAPAVIVDRLTPELRETALVIARKLLDRPEFHSKCRSPDRSA